MKSEKIIATFLGLGYLPIASGTVAAFCSCLLLFLLQDFGISWLVILVVLLFVFGLGVYVSSALEKEWGKDDNRIVVDEVFGMWVSLLFVPHQMKNYLVAFALFRLFDIAKPLGIRHLESLEKGWGVMADDFLAGIYANALFHLGHYYLK
jgi:phosphatidylglycerophosphatase A